MAASVVGGLPGKGHGISLAALRRHDPYISRIEDVASQVALYTFGHRANEWVRADAAAVQTAGRGDGGRMLGMDRRAGSGPGGGRAARPTGRWGRWIPKVWPVPPRARHRP